MREEKTLKRFSHWTIKYISNRLKVFIFEKRFPENPWLTKDAIFLLDKSLDSSMHGVEFGSGRSTKWFARKVNFLVSIEHDQEWYEKVSSSLRANEVSNVKYNLCQINEYDENNGENSDYVCILDTFNDSSLDFVLVDGIYRSDCALKALRKIRSGGLLIIDNANWFIPSSTIAPGSRNFQTGPLTNKWASLLDELSDWKMKWTSNGVWDTAIYIKPPVSQPLLESLGTNLK